MVKEIICKTDGAAILVDDEDYSLLSRFPWYRGGMGAHPMTFIYGKRDTSQTVYMHQLIMGGMVGADHIDLNVCNMQKSNLRAATMQENGWNKGKPNFKNKVATSRFKGVSYSPFKGRDRWVVLIKHVPPGEKKQNGQTLRCGYFFYEIEAAIAYNKKVVELRGEFAWVNPIPGPDDKSLTNNDVEYYATKG